MIKLFKIKGHFFILTGRERWARMAAERAKLHKPQPARSGYGNYGDRRNLPNEDDQNVGRNRDFDMERNAHAFNTDARNYHDNWDKNKPAYSERTAEFDASRSRNAESEANRSRNAESEANRSQNAESEASRSRNGKQRKSRFSSEPAVSMSTVTDMEIILAAEQNPFASDDIKKQNSFESNISSTSNVYSSHNQSNVYSSQNQSLVRHQTLSSSLPGSFPPSGPPTLSEQQFRHGPGASYGQTYMSGFNQTRPPLSVGPPPPPLNPSSQPPPHFDPAFRPPPPFDPASQSSVPAFDPATQSRPTLSQAPPPFQQHAFNHSRLPFNQPSPYAPLIPSFGQTMPSFNSSSGPYFSSQSSEDKMAENMSSSQEQQQAMQLSQFPQQLPKKQVPVAFEQRKLQLNLEDQPGLMKSPQFDNKSNHHSKQVEQTSNVGPQQKNPGFGLKPFSIGQKVSPANMSQGQGLQVPPPQPPPPTVQPHQQSRVGISNVAETQHWAPVPPPPPPSSKGVMHFILQPPPPPPPPAKS